jgi:MHS family proline/betaine transporter-like MFS transporter
MAVTVTNGYRHASHALQQTRVFVGIALRPNPIDLGPQIHLIECAQFAHTGHIETDNFFAFGLRQTSQNGQTALTHAQRDPSADVARERTNGKRAFSAMWGSWGATLGTLLGSAVGFSVASILTQEEMVSWGWRLSFIMGGFVAMLGLWLRRGHEEEHPVSQSKAPQKDIFTKHRWAVMRVALLNIGNAVAFYTIFVYAVSFLEQVVHFSDQKALRNNSIAMAFILLVMPLSAKMADRYGRKGVLLVGFLMLTLSAIPLFHVIAQGIRWVTISCHLALSLGLGIVSGAIAAANVELMPRDIRCTGLAFSYNLSVGVFGGLTPLVITWLTEYLNNPSAPGYWVAGASLISLLTLLFSVKETQNNPL